MIGCFPTGCPEGLDLIQRVMEEILRLNVQFVFAGHPIGFAGRRPMYEYFFRNVEHRYRDKPGVYTV